MIVFALLFALVLVVFGVFTTLKWLLLVAFFVALLGALA